MCLCVHACMYVCMCVWVCDDYRDNNVALNQGDNETIWLPSSLVSSSFTLLALMFLAFLFFTLSMSTIALAAVLMIPSVANRLLFSCCCCCFAHLDNNHNQNQWWLFYGVSLCVCTHARTLKKRNMVISSARLVYDNSNIFSSYLCIFDEIQFISDSCFPSVENDAMEIEGASRHFMWFAISIRLLFSIAYGRGIKTKCTT